MKRFFNISFSFFIVFGTFIEVFSQNQDTTKRNSDTTLFLNELVITSTRTNRRWIDIPAQTTVITTQNISEQALNNIDDILRSSANVYVNRSWGIYSKNSSVTMRGLESSDRTLILVDGVPKNKLSGGAVNWHNINTENIERIEVIKGPASALYGNNAMGGVINIITKKPVKPFEAVGKLFTASHSTYGATGFASSSKVKNFKGLYSNIYGNYRQGEGYIFEPAEALDTTDLGTFLKEFGAGGKIGYQLGEKHSLEADFDIYDEERGGGREVFVDKGSYDAFKTQQYKLNYKNNLKGFNISINSYYLYEDYYGQKESYNEYLEYRLSDANTYKNDYGFWSMLSTPEHRNHVLTSGIELRKGSVTGNEIYRTSPDVIQYEGKLDIYAFFIQDEFNLYKHKLQAILGVRCDYINFRDSWQKITNPTKVTGFDSSFYESFNNNNWFAYSPKVNLEYKFNNSTKLYVSFASGFKPPKIDDLAKSGKIRKGFRLANPSLKPEILYNYEVGMSMGFKKIIVNGAAYYSDGRDFHYLVANGDSVDTGGQSLKAVYKRENVARIEVIGAEISIRYFATNKLTFDANYSYNHSIIKDFAISADNPTKDLKGLYIIEVSPHLFYAGMAWKSNWVNIGINCNYTDGQYVDDENLQLLDDFFIVNTKVSKNITPRIGIWLDVQNIFDKEFIDRKNQLSPGRFIGGGIQFKI